MHTQRILRHHDNVQRTNSAASLKYCQVNACLSGCVHECTRTWPEGVNAEEFLPHKDDMCMGSSAGREGEQHSRHNKTRGRWAMTETRQTKWGCMNTNETKSSKYEWRCGGREIMVLETGRC